MIKELQDKMPWTNLWSEDFLGDPRSYAKYEHCLINIAAKLGTLLQQIEMSDHYSKDYELGLDKNKAGTALAIIIMSALKAANVYPDGKINIEEFINRDLKRRKVID